MRSTLISLLFTTFTSACIYPRDTGSAHWSYDGTLGPALWHSLSPEYSLCATGSHQSPINISPSSISTSTSVKLSYPTNGRFTVTNNGHAIEADAVQNYTAVLEDNSYFLKNIHFHLPSEHHLNGRSYPLETHFVHSTADGKLAVVGILFEIQKVRTTQLIRKLPLEKVETEGAKTDEITLPLRETVKFVNEATKYTYAGSLTTPPCTEGVTWFVVGEPMPIELGDYQRLWKATGGFNARFTQNQPGEENLLRIAAQVEEED